MLGCVRCRAKKNYVFHGYPCKFLDSGYADLYLAFGTSCDTTMAALTSTKKIYSLTLIFATICCNGILAKLVSHQREVAEAVNGILDLQLKLVQSKMALYKKC